MKKPQEFFVKVKKLISFPRQVTCDPFVEEQRQFFVLFGQPVLKVVLFYFM